MSRGKECKRMKLEKNSFVHFFATHYFKDHIFHTYLATPKKCVQLKNQWKRTSNIPWNNDEDNELWT